MSSQIRRKVIGDSDMNAQQLTCERVLYDELVYLKRMLLKYQAASLMHDPATVDDYVDARSQQAVEEEIAQLIKNLIKVKGSHPTHRITAYAQLFNTLNSDIEKLIFTTERKKVQELRNDVKYQHEQSRSTIDTYLNTIAKLKNNVQSLEIINKEMQSKLDEVNKEKEYTARELLKRNRDNQQVHQNIVELRMQGIDFKSEINRRSVKVLRSIQSRMGFVPSGVQKQILLLNILKVIRYKYYYYYYIIIK